jgi:hypothetical protein
MFEIPAGTTLPAPGYVVFHEAAASPLPNHFGPIGFGLSGTQGDEVWLVQVDASGKVTHFVDDIHFGGSAIGESLGRFPDGDGRLAPMASMTLGAANGVPRIGPVLISEIQHNPGEPSAAALQIEPNLDAGDLEFVEIHNPTSATFDVAHWRLVGGIEFTFDSGATLGPDETLVIVRFDPQRAENAGRVAAFREHYGIDPSVRLVGGYTGRLYSSGEKIQLVRADSASAGPTPSVVLVLEDETIYDDQAPWPMETGEAGQSLIRTGPNDFGPAATSWRRGTPTPGAVDLVLAGDMEFDGDLDFDDIADLILAQTDSDAYESRYGSSALIGGDITRDGRIDEADIDAIVALLMFGP